jgi:hypothetical protein
MSRVRANHPDTHIQESDMIDFSEHTSEALADLAGQYTDAKKTMELKLAAIKDELRSRGVTSVSGEAYDITITEQISSRLDTEEVKAFLGSVRVKKFMKDVCSTVLRVKAKAQHGQAA